MTKPTKWLCVQRRLRSAWASAQSDQSLLCPHEETLGLQLPIECTAKTLIRLGGCPGWSESSLGAQSFCCFCHVVAQVSQYANGPVSRRCFTREISRKIELITLLPGSRLCVQFVIRLQSRDREFEPLLGHITFVELSTNQRMFLCLNPPQTWLGL